MSFFDDVVGGLEQKNAGGGAGAMRLWRRMRDRRVRDHVVGCYLVQKKVGPELLAYVDSHIWAQEFKMNSLAILAEWNILCESEGVPMQARAIRFQVSTRVHRAEEGAGAAVADPYAPADLPPLTPEEDSCVDGMVGVISDGQMRERARRAVMASFRWKKSKDA